MTPIKRILVPTDFSEAADTAYDYALGLASQMNAAVSLVHVFEDPLVTSLYSVQYVPMPAEMRTAILEDIQQQLAKRVAKRGTVDVTSATLVGSTARAIVDAARDLGADLIVMGTHGRHGVSHLLLGSVAERVVQTATCPVLTMRGAAPATSA